MKAFEGKCYSLINSYDHAVKNSWTCRELSALRFKMDKAIEIFHSLEKEMNT